MIDRLDQNEALMPRHDRPARGNPKQEDFQKALGDQRASEYNMETTAMQYPTEFAPSSEAPIPVGNARKVEALGIPVESILLPWQLIAQGAMSQIARAPLAIMQLPTRVKEDSVDHSSESAQGRFAESNLLVSAEANTASTVTSGPTLSPSIFTELASKLDETKVARSLGAGMPNPWSERMVRWITDANQSVTAWVRDYRLTDDDIRIVVDRLIEHSKSQGVPLSRVVVNGKQCWCAEQTLTGELR